MANGNTRDVTLRIRGKDESGPAAKSAENNINRLVAAQKRSQARRDLYAGATQSTKDLKQAYDAAAQSAVKFGRQMDDVKNWRWSKDVVEDPERLAENFEQSRAAARRAKAEYLDAAAALSKLRGRQGGFAAFDDIAKGATKADAAVDDLTNSLNRMGAAQQRRAAASGRAPAAPVGDARLPMGLRPHEMQNLGYQVNDLITQIASGTSPMQAFAQQGGQIAQIFPKATSAILRFSPAIAAAALILSPFVVALKQMNDEAKRIEAVSTAMATSGNAASYSKKELQDYAKTLQDMGVKADEVGGVLRNSLREAVDPAYLERFATSARGLSKVTGDELTDSINEVTSAFTGNADEVLALDDKLGFLSASERKHIEKLRESKKDAEARTEAFAIFERKYGAIAAKMDGSWDRTLSNFGQAWGAFGRFMLDGIQWDAIKSQIGGVMNMIAEMTAKLPGVQRTAREALAAQHAGYDRQIAALNGRPDGGSTRGGRSGPTVKQERDRLIRERDDVIRQITVIDQTVAANQRRQQPKDTTTRPPEVANQDKPDKPKKTDADRLAERQSDYLESLKESNAQRAFELTLIGKAEREAQILSEIESERNKAKDVGLTLTAEQETSIRESVGALYDAQKAQEAAAQIDEWRLQLAQARGEAESRNAYIERMLAKEAQGWDQSKIAAGREMLGLLYDQEASKRRQAELESAVADKQALRQELLQQIQAAADTGDTARLAGLRERLAQVNVEMASLIQSTLAWLRTQTGPEFEAIILKFEGWAKAIDDVGAKAVVTGTQINDMLSQGGANALDQFVQSIGEGQNAIEALRDSFLQYAADFLRQIATMIAQQMILNALGGGNGTASGTGGQIAGWINGLFRHSGGLVGSGGGFRSVNPAVFAGAMRYHSGGLAGLAPNEVPAILLRNEEVLTEDDPRHRNNGGLGGKSGSVKVVNVFDPADALDRGLATESGEQSFFNFVRRNAQTFKALLG